MLVWTKACLDEMFVPADFAGKFYIDRVKHPNKSGHLPNGKYVGSGLPVFNVSWLVGGQIYWNDVRAVNRNALKAALKEMWPKCTTSR